MKITSSVGSYEIQDLTQSFEVKDLTMVSVVLVLLVLVCVEIHILVGLRCALKYHTRINRCCQRILSPWPL